MKLNPAQQKAVQAGGGPQLILAGAGSGKTRTIVHRIGHLISHVGIAPHRILAVTFTNKAAAELKERLSALIGDEGGGVVSGTFHAISLRLLRQYAETLGYPRTFQVIDGDDQKVLAKRILKARNIDSERLHPGYLLGWIEQCKNAGLTPDAAPPTEWNGIDLVELYSAYQAELKRLERMDFGDLLLNTVRLMEKHQDIAAAIAAKFDYVLVDEYQDTNPVQHMWLQLLCRGHGNITVVGDDDQSIYGWRGADVNHILDFTRLWQGAQVHRLEENYRSTGAILALANAVIRANADRHEKVLRPTREMGEKPLLVACRDEYDEARRIREFLVGRHRQGLPWQEMAVLYRSNRQSLPLEQVLGEARIPYRVVGSIGFFERQEIKDALAYWALLHECADALHLLRICNKPKRGIGAKGQEKIAAELAASGMRVHEWLDAIAQGHAGGVAAKLRPLAELLRRVRATAMAKPDLGLGEVLEASGYLDALQAHGQLEAVSRLENIRTLQGFIEASMAEGLTPTEFMDRAALLQSGEEQQSTDAVSLMSLHRAKGLEFDSVVLAGVEEGLLPHQRALEEGMHAIAEERRLLYVGITRAKNYLLLTYSRMRRVFGDVLYPLPSRFIADIGDNVLAREEAKAPEAVTSGPGLTSGMRVTHPTFGEGIVLGLEGEGDGIRVTVRFRRAGTKRLMLKYAALQPL